MKRTNFVSLFSLAKFSPVKLSPAKISLSVFLPVIVFTSALLVALTAAVFLTSQPVFGQASTPGLTSQHRPAEVENQNANTNTKSSDVAMIFGGKIVRSGDKFVLSDSATATTYQLDDQQKAREFLNRNVKVTGVLDPATGTIHVSAIDPA